MKKATGLGPRLIECIKRKGYKDPEAKFGIAVTRFALDHRYPPGFVYKWISEEAVPTRDTILRLAHDLSTTAGWLHYGEKPVNVQTSVPRGRRKSVSIAGASDAAESHPSGPNVRRATLCQVGAWLSSLLARPMLLPA